MQDFILKNGKVFDGKHFIQADLLIENGKIASIDKVKKSKCFCIDVSDCIISSGLIDIHTHLSEMGSEKYGFPADMATIPFGVLYAIDACAEKSNIEILNNLCVETKVFIPLRLNGTKIDFNKMERDCALYGDKVIGVKVFFDESQNSDIGLEHLRLAREFAKTRNFKLMVHSSYSPVPMIDIINVLQKGDILTHSYHGGYHTIDENDYMAYKVAKEKGVIIDAGMAGGCHTDFEILRKSIVLGYIPDTISSDITKCSAYIRGGVYGLPMCMSIMKTLGMEESKILCATTKNAATAVGQEGWFSLQVGSKANLSVLKYENTLIDISDARGNRVLNEKGYVCKMTVKNGQILYRN